MTQRSLVATAIEGYVIPSLRQQVWESVLFLRGGVQHIFDEDAVAGCWVVDQDMGKVMIPTRFDGLSNTDSVESACVIQTKPI